MPAAIGNWAISFITSSSALMGSRSRLVMMGLLLVIGTLRAEETPSLQTVREHRAGGRPDLALRTVEELRRASPASPDTADLTLEAALASLDWCRKSVDTGTPDETRLVMARRECSKFLESFPADARAADVSLGLAQTLARYGKAQVNRGEQAGSPSATSAARSLARATLEEADRRFEQARAILGALGPSNKKPANAGRSTEARLCLERAVNLLELSRTLGPSLAETEHHTQVVGKAVGLLREVVGGAGKGPLLWEARAWLGRCYHELDDPQKALAEYKDVIWDGGPQAEPGRRLARYFRMVLYDQNPDLYRAVRGDAAQEIVRSGEEWLRTYPGEQATLEGQGVRFLLANAYVKQAAKLAKNQAMPSIQARRLYAESLRLYDSLARVPGAYAAHAREGRLVVVMALARTRPLTALPQLATFDECYLRAQVEMGQLAEEERALPGDAGDAARQQHSRARLERLRTMVATLRRALDVAAPDTPIEDRVEVRYLLGYAYLATGDVRQAAVVSEELARSEPRCNRAAKAAGHALQAYAQILSDGERAGAPATAMEVDRTRLSALARFAEATWPTEPAADLARHQLGALAMRDRRYAEAVADLARITPGYVAYTASQYELANAATLAHEANLAPPRGQPGYLEQAVVALGRIPDLSDLADAATTEVYAYARLKLARMLYAARQFDALGRLAERLSREVADARFRGVPRLAREALEELPSYVSFVRAEEAFHAGRYADVRALTTPAITRAAEGVASRSPQLRNGLLSLALRAEIRLGDAKRAREVLGLLQAAAGPTGENGRATVLADLVAQFRAEVEDLRRGGPAVRKELDESIAKTTAFLDELNTTIGTQSAPELVRFLAFGYASLEKHERAAQAIAKLPRPGAGHRAADLPMRLLLARELRLAKQFDQAEAVLAELAGADVGRRSRERRYEQIYLLEDRGKLGQAAREWDLLMKGLGRQFGQHPEWEDARRQGTLKPAQLEQLAVEDQHRVEYYECYYHVVDCYARYAIGQAESTRRTTLLERAAGFILRLERGQPELWGDSLKTRYDELFIKQPLLKETYERLKALGS